MYFVLSYKKLQRYNICVPHKNTAMQLSIPFKMSHLLAFCVLCLSAVFASVDNRAAVSSPSPSEDIKNNNSFYYGPSKKVEYVLRYTKKQLDKLQRKVEVLTAHKRTEGRL